MRSRYSAYANGFTDYIIATTHHSKRKIDEKSWRHDIAQFSQHTHFEGLTITEFVDGATEAFVTFTAHLTQNGNNVSFTERSRFLKEGPQWFYVDRA